MPARAPRRAMDVDALDVDLRVPDDREVRRRRDGTRRNATRQLETNLNSKLKRTTDDAMRRRRQGLTRRAKELRELRATLARELARRRREAFGEDDETAAPSGAKEEEENDDDDDDVRGDDARGEECVFEDDDATVPNARSLSDGEEYAAAVAAALEPTIPQSDDFAAAGDDGGDDGVDAHDGGGRSIPTVLDGDDEALATLEALGVASESETRGTDSKRKRGRIEETPMAVGADEGVDARDRVAESPGRVLRFSVGASLGLDDDDLVAAAEARERAEATPAKDASVAYVRAMTTRFDGGAPVRVAFSDTMRGANAAQHLGVVVETSGGASMDALVFRVDVDAATYVGSCSLHETRSSPSQRTTRRRSSIGATATAASAPPSADAVRVSPHGRFVFAAHDEDGVRLLAVRDGDVPASKNASTSSDVVKHLECGFKVTRVATTMGESGFLLAAAGEPGRCVVWSWSVNDANDDEFLLKEHVTCDEMPAMNYRGVVPKPGTPTSLQWLDVDRNPKIVAVVDEGLTYVWNVLEKARDRSSYAIDHGIRSLIPVHCEGVPSRGPAEDEPLAAVALARRKRAPLLDLESKDSSDDSLSSERGESCAIGAALIRVHGLSIGESLFASESSTAVSLACAGEDACFGARDGAFVAWNIATGECALKVLLAVPASGELTDDQDLAVRSVACAERHVAACCGDGVFVFAKSAPRAS